MENKTIHGMIQMVNFQIEIAATHAVAAEEDGRLEAEIYWTKRIDNCYELIDRLNLLFTDTSLDIGNPENFS